MGGSGNLDTIPWCGPAPDPAALLGSWTLHPVLLAALAACLVIGLQRAERRGMVCMAWAALVIAFVSPLCGLTTALFSARAVHHLLLVSVAAPLLGLGLPLRGGRGSGGMASVSLLVTVGVLTLWHLPAVYTAAWDSTAVYWLMQCALLLPAWAFWSAILPAQQRDAGAALVNAALVGSLAGVMGLIGAVLTFSDRLLYSEHMLAPLAWGIEPLADQQAAGLIMWVPGLVPLAVVAGALARRVWRLGEAA